MLILAALVLAAGAAATPASAPLERFKALAGDWIAAEDGDMVKKGDLVTTVYHADGPDLVLTHYCMEGNQPRMRAKGAQGPRFDFAFDGGTHIDQSRDRHMHSAVVDLAGPDEIRSQWNEIAGGKTVFVARMHLVRKTR